MMSSRVPNPVTNNPDQRRKRKKKTRAQASQPHTKWKSESQQQIYSSKLLQALARVSDGARTGGRAVREAADRALAYSAKGKTRWSRAILTNRIKLRFRKQRRQRSAAAASSGSNRSKKPRVGALRLKRKTLPAVQRKVKVLSRLVPGCRKEPLPVILEEVTDYIEALEMQVRTMSALARLLSGPGPSASSEPPPSG